MSRAGKLFKLAPLVAALAVLTGCWYQSEEKAEVVAAAAPASALQAPAKESVDADLIADEVVMRDLFGLPNKHGPFRIKAKDFGLQDQNSEQEVALWFQQSLDFGGNRYHVAFVLLKNIDTETNQPVVCFACPVLVSAVTYRHSDDGWVVMSRQIVPFATVGDSGEIGDLNRAEVLALSERNIALMIPHSLMRYGWFSDGEFLLGFNGKEWADLGYLETGASNDGTCDDEAGPAGPDSPDNLGPCVKYEGKIIVDPATAQLSYPNLIVTMQGTNLGKDYRHGPAEPAKPTLYIFKNNEYTLVD